jgi:hypothetical protein
VFVSGGEVLAIDSSGNAYVYNDYPTNSWTKQTAWGQVYGLQVDAEGNIWSLYTSSSYCSTIGGGYSVGLWNGSGWTLESYCFTQLSIAQDGSNAILTIDPNGTLWTNQGGWQHASVPSPWQPTISAVSLTATTYAIVRQDGTIWSYNGTAWTQLPGGSASYITANLAGDFYVIANGTNENVYHWNGSSWDFLTGSGFTSIAAADAFNVWGVGSTIGSNNIYRFSELAVQHTRTVRGEAINCPSGCTGIMHTIKVQAGWNGSYGFQNEQVVAPLTQVNLSAGADVFDPFLCLEDDSSCIPYADDSVVCSQAGTLLTDNLNPAHSDVLEVPQRPLWSGGNGYRGTVSLTSLSVR